MNDYADLEIALSHHEEDQYRVELKFRRPGSDVVDSIDPGLITLDLDHVGGLDDPADHGQALKESLFDLPEVGTRFAQARAIAGSQHLPLRLRFRFDWLAAGLHTLRWETLRDPQNPSAFLASDENILLSRYLRVWGEKAIGLQPKGELKALVVIANPAGTGTWNLAAVDVQGELDRARAGLAEMAPLTALCCPDEPDPACVGKPTLVNLRTHLRDGYDILYLVAHGKVIEGRPWIWLEDEAGSFEMVTTEEGPAPGGGETAGLITWLGQLPNPPRLVVLASCQSAGEGDLWSSQDSGALSALGPALVKAGVPAVIAMQGDVTMESVARFTPAFFRELRRDGQIDRAMAAARAELEIHHRADWWTPVLYMRLESGQLAVGEKAAAAGPFMVPELRDVVRRPALMEQVMPLLLNGAGRPRKTVALHGFGGFGKTTLARAICHQAEVQEAYGDGILWATLGESPQVLQALASLHAALTGEWQNFGSEDDAARALAEQLDGKRCLLVIDDVWNPAHLQPFLRGGDNCVRLITTRMFAVASEATEKVDVEEMTVEEAAALLTMRLDPKPADLAPFRILADRLGQWPLMLELAEATLRQRLKRGDSLAGALAYLNEALDEEGVVAFDQRNAVERNQAIANTLAVSLRLLSEAEVDRFTELAIFAQDVDIPLSALELLWGLSPFKTERLCELLSDLSLAKFDLQTGTLRLHDVMHAYLAERLAAPAALHQKLVDAWGDPYHLPTNYAWRWIAYHLAEAARASTTLEDRHLVTERLVELVLDEGFQAAHLEALRDPASLHEDLRLALQVAAEDLYEFGLLLVVKAARGLIAFRQEKLAPAQIFVRASEGDVEAAMRQLALFTVEREWRQAASMIVAWLAAKNEEKAGEAKALFQQIRAQIPDGEFGPLDTLARRVSALLYKTDWPESWLPEGVTRERVDSIIARMAGLKDKLGLPAEGAYEAVFEADPTVSSYTASIQMTYLDSRELVSYAAAHPGEEHTYVDDHLAILAANSYVRYRNKFLWQLLDAVLQHPDDSQWAMEYASRVTEAALSANKLEFQEALPITILALQARANAPDARQQLDQYCQSVQKVAWTLVPDESRGDSWGSYNRRLAALAQGYRLLEEPAIAAELLQLARSLHYGFAGFTAPARLTLAETIRACDGADWQASAMLDAAAESARYVQNDVLRAQTMARVEAIRERWWGALLSGMSLDGWVGQLRDQPQDPTFAALHPTGWFPAITLADLVTLYGQPLEEFVRLNPGLAGDSPLPARVDVPDPEMLPLVAARLAAEVLVAPVPPEERVRLIQLLVPVAAANPTALDTVLSRLLVGAAPLMAPGIVGALAGEFKDVAQHLADLLARDIPATYMAEGVDFIGLGTSVIVPGTGSHDPPDDL